MGRLNPQESIVNQLGPSNHQDVPYTIWEGPIFEWPVRIYHPPEIFTAEGATPDSANRVIVTIPTHLKFNLRLAPNNILRNIVQTIRHWFHQNKKISHPKHPVVLAFSDQPDQAKPFLANNTHAIELLMEIFHNIELKNNYSAQGTIFLHNEENMSDLNQTLEMFVHTFSGHSKE